MSIRISSRTVATVLLAVAAGGCAAGGNTDDSGDLAAALVDGPLTVGESLGTVCVSGIESGEFVLGDDVVDAAGASQDATIEAVELVSPNGLELAQAFLLPVDGALVGTWSQFPPPSAKSGPTVQPWKARIAAEGAPITAGKTYNLVLRLRALQPGNPSEVERIRVQYSIAGERYAEVTPTTFQVRRHC